MKVNFNKKKISSFIESNVNKVFEETIKLLNIPSNDLEINVAIVNSFKIKKINREFRSVNRVTDVISFPFLLTVGKGGMQLIVDNLTKENYPFNINPETGNIVLGDLYICFNKVKKQAKEYGTGIEREFAYLTLHGILHLLGYDHIDEEDKKIMREKEELILKNVFEK